MDTSFCFVLFLQVDTSFMIFLGYKIADIFTVLIVDRSACQDYQSSVIPNTGSRFICSDKWNMINK